jgi:hypothetical protein
LAVAQFGRGLFFMKSYIIYSPNGKKHTLTAESFYHAVQIAKKADNYLFAEQQYFKLNTERK